jgi:hypothetical protein
MKKFLLVTAGLFGIIISGCLSANSGITDVNSGIVNSGINEKVLHSFHSEYGDPLNARWVSYPHSDYVVFEQNNILVRCEYDLKGNQLFAIRYFDAKDLPLPILDNVQEQFPNETIDVVTEVTTPVGMSYVIQLEDKQSFTTLISDMDGNIAVRNQFQKAG